MRLSIRHFVVVSVLAHTAILAMWVSMQSHLFQIPATASSAPTLSVALVTQKNTARQHHTATKQHKATTTNVKTVQPQQKQIARTKTAVASQVTEASSIPNNAAYQAELHRDQLRARVLSKIRNNLQQYFVYPQLAQRQGWQGRVLLRFSVEADGMIHNIHVAAGSGYAVLDTSAVNALAQVHHLYEAGEWLQGQRLDLQMPIIFRLQGG